MNCPHCKTNIDDFIHSTLNKEREQERNRLIEKVEGERIRFWKKYEEPRIEEVFSDILTILKENEAKNLKITKCSMCKKMFSWTEVIRVRGLGMWCKRCLDKDEEEVGGTKAGGVI